MQPELTGYDPDLGYIKNHFSGPVYCQGSEQEFIQIFKLYRNEGEVLSCAQLLVLYF